MTLNIKRTTCHEHNYKISTNLKSNYEKKKKKQRRKTERKQKEGEKNTRSHKWSVALNNRLNKKHCMRLAEPETLQNTYKPHKCCIRRFLFCFLKLFFFLVPNMLVPQIIRLRQRARAHRIGLLTATQGQIALAVH